MPILFHASQLDQLKKLNEDLSGKIIARSDEILQETLEEIADLKRDFPDYQVSDYEPYSPLYFRTIALMKSYTEKMDQMIADHFPTSKTISIVDIMQYPDYSTTFSNSVAIGYIKDSFQSDKSGVPVFQIAFPPQDENCNPEISDNPIMYPMLGTWQNSPINKINTAIARLVDKPISENSWRFAKDNPPPYNHNWSYTAPENQVVVFSGSTEEEAKKRFQSFCSNINSGICNSSNSSVTYQYDEQENLYKINLQYLLPSLPRDFSNFQCSITPFMQNYILSADQYFKVNGTQQVIFSSPNISNPYPDNLHFIGAIYKGGEESAAFVNSIGGNEMLFEVNPFALPNINIGNIIHETLH